MGNPFDIARALGDHMIVWGVVFAVLTPFELLFPRERQSLSGRLRGLAFWALWIPFSDLVFMGLGAAWRSIGVEPLVTIPLTMKWTGIAAALISPILGAAFGDLAFYWLHRAQHRWFWRFHAVHHSIRELSAINCYHHVSEAFITTAIVIVPTSLIVAHSLPATGMVQLIILLQSVFIHSSSRLHFGPMRVLIVDNRFHRIHHSVENHHFDHNFAAFTPLWDVVFGTSHFPRSEEWPDVGIAELDEPKSIREWIDLPARYARATARPTVAGISGMPATESLSTAAGNGG